MVVVARKATQYKKEMGYKLEAKTKLLKKNKFTEVTNCQYLREANK